MSELAEVTKPKPLSLIAKIADRYSVEPAKLADTLKATAFKSSTPVTNEQLMALLIVADQYKLNPFTKELFAFPDKGGIVPVVSVDGWSRIINEHPQFDGVEFSWDANEGAMTCVMYRKDRTHPTVVTEYMDECKRGTQPWNSHPRRMLRHKALIQCARIAFGFAGIYDEDEAQRIVHMGPVNEVKVEPVSTTAASVRQVIKPAKREAAPVMVEQVPEEEYPDDVGPTADDYIKAVQVASDAQAAAQHMDEARTSLGADDLQKLAEAFRAKWGE